MESTLFIQIHNSPTANILSFLTKDHFLIKYMKILLMKRRKL